MPDQTRPTLAAIIAAGARMNAAVRDSDQQHAAAGAFIDLLHARRHPLLSIMAVTPAVLTIRCRLASRRRRRRAAR